MAETYRLRHPRADTVVEVTSAGRRDTFLRRGWTSVVEGGETKPKAGQKRRSKPKADEE